MKIKTTFLLLISVLFLSGNMTVKAQPTEVWKELHPTWNATGSLHYNFRGIAYNENNNHLYVAGNDGAAATAADNKIMVLDASTSLVIKTLTLEPLSLAEMGYGIKDVEVDDAGGIYAIITSQNRFHPEKLFYWANEDASPIQLWVDSPARYAHSLDFSGGFSVTGDYNTEALIIIPFHNEDSLYYFEATNGNLGDLKLMGLGVAGHGATHAHVQALGTTIASGFWYNNSLLQNPTLFDGSGSIVGAIDAALFTGTTAGAKPFTAGGNDYLAVSNAGNVTIVDLTGAAADFSDVEAADIVSIAGVASPASSIHGYGQEECIKVNPDGSYAIFSFSAYRYTKELATEGAPTAIDVLLTGTPAVGEDLSVQYTYVDINNDSEGSSTIAWYRSDDAAGLVNPEELTGNANQTTYSLSAADADKYISYTIIPTAMTGTVSSLNHLKQSNLVGPVLTDNPPVATDLAIAGTVEIGQTLTASYTYNDVEGDIEGSSIYEWSRADDAAGAGAISVATASLTYVPVADDGGKFIIFTVTPVAATGNSPTGTAVSVATATTVPYAATPPTASNLAIAGIEEVSRTLTGSYVYADINDDVEGATLIKWYRADDAAGTGATEVASGSLTYELLAADEAKYMLFEVTPVTDAGETGTAVSTASGAIAAKPADAAPEATGVVMIGTPEVGILMSATYTYTDYAADPEGASIYKWYTADDATGTGQSEISGATKQTLLISETEVGKFIAFEITPVAQTGGLLEGTAVMTNYSTVAAIASTHSEGIERLWRGASNTGGVPYYINSAATTERGFAIGADHIYIASRNGGTKVIVIDKNDGSFVRELSTVGIEDGIYTINDIEVSDDGQILAAPLNDALDFWIYKWTDELADPVKWLTVTLPETMRLGDKFSVTGDVSGNAIIMAARSGGNHIVRWVVTGGVAADAEILTLNGLASMETSPAVVPFSASIDANILVDGKGLAPRIFDKDMNQIGSIEKIDDYSAYKIQSNSPNVFQYKGRTMAAFFQAMRKEPLGARIIIADITAPPYQIVDSTEYVSNSMAWDGYIGEVDVTTDGEFYYAYILQAKNAIAAYKGKLELPQFVSAITTFEGDKLMAEFDMAIEEISKTDADVWTLSADGSALVIDTVYSSGTTVTFDLVTAITESQVVLLSYDGTGTISSFNGMPLAAFGPESVENIVGAEVPTASAVSISGTAMPDEVLTGAYTFADADGDAEGASLYQWYEATDATGSDKLKILGEKSITITISSNLLDKYVGFEVIPVSATGGDAYLEGLAVISDFVLITDVSVGLNGIDHSMIYPNPVADMLTISSSTLINSLSLVDITGKVLMRMDNLNETEIQLSMESYEAGIYYLNVRNENGQSKVHSFVKTQ